MKRFSSFFLSFVIVFLMATTSVFASEETILEQPISEKSISTEVTEYVIDSSQLEIEGLENLDLEDGEVLRIPLEYDQAYIDYKNSNSKARVIFQGNAGYIDIYPSGMSVRYQVVMYEPATSFVGYINVTDISTGSSHGSSGVMGFSGSTTILATQGHMYSASLSGTALFGVVPVATVGWNYITWIY